MLTCAQANPPPPPQGFRGHSRQIELYLVKPLGFGHTMETICGKVTYAPPPLQRNWSRTPMNLLGMLFFPLQNMASVP